MANPKQLLKLTTSVKDLENFATRRARIQRAFKRVTNRNVSRSLAFIRGTAIRVLRRRKAPSKPGKPPHVHAPSGEARSLKKILFDFDWRSSSGIVGPVWFKPNTYGVKSATSAAVPGILERGGTFIYMEEKIPGWRGQPDRWVVRKRSRRSTRPPETRQRRVVIQPRPYMSEALKRTQQAGKLLTPWVNSIGS